MLIMLCTWFVGSDLSSESMSISNVIYMSQVTVSIGVRVAALNITVSISMLLASLSEVTRVMVTSGNVEAILVWDWLSL